jgi:hypothetical protein
VRYDRWTDNRWNWNGYLAQHRSGGLEFGLGRPGSARWRRGQEEDETHVFFLTTIVGRVWLGLALFAEVRERSAIEGPWEITLALRDTEQAVIGNVAAGWAEPERTFPLEEPSRCPDPSVLIVRELQEWPRSGRAPGAGVRHLVEHRGCVRRSRAAIPGSRRSGCRHVRFEPVPVGKLMFAGKQCLNGITDARLCTQGQVLWVCKKRALLAATIHSVYSRPRCRSGTHFWDSWKRDLGMATS